MKAPLAFVLGTRPEAIKLAPVVLAARQAGWPTFLCATGQQARAGAQLHPFGLDVDRALPLSAGALPTFLGQAVQAVGEALEEVRPWAVVVQGDTTSALAGGLAAAQLGLPVVHVEAGLRSFDVRAPFPEETNRVLLSHLARLHCAPTAQAAANLAREGLTRGVVVTGNPGLDALRLLQPALDAVAATLEGRIPSAGRRWLLATLHRRESFGAPLEGMCQALEALVEAHPDVELVWPVHPHPAVQGPVRAALAGVPRIHLLEPLPHLELLALLRRAHLVLTDSGGLQEEAPALGVPVLVLRDVTERPEGVAAGAALLVGTQPARIVEAASALLSSPEAHRAMARVRFPYGDGYAAQAIVRAMATLADSR